MAETRDANLPSGASDYPAEPGVFDEAFIAAGEVRPLYQPMLADLAGGDLHEIAATVIRQVEKAGLDFGDAGFPVDPIPRLIAGDEWSRLEAGLVQRMRALNAFIKDVYGAQKAFADGALPERLATTSDGYEPAMRGLLEERAAPLGMAGFDIVRSPAGELMVLEDNLRMPSGLTYATTIRAAVADALDLPLAPRPLEGFTARFGECLRAAAIAGSEGNVALLSEGPDSGAFSEHRMLSAELGIPIVTARELSTARGRLHARLDGRRAPIDVLYRRVDDERLTKPDGTPTELGELLLPALRAGSLTCINSFGTGIGDDKLTHAYTEPIIRYYLGEEPLLRSVPAYDLAHTNEREEAMDRLEALVIKPRGGFGGSGVVLMSEATESARREALTRVKSAPERFVAQEMVRLSTHPTLCDEGLRPRHVDLRPFAATDGANTHVLQGGLTRYATGAGEMVVNSSQGGGGKDTWVVQA
jgi:uncharacterized circularly permuted ATP-grasp superfamily protein